MKKGRENCIRPEGIYNHIGNQTYFLYMTNIPLHVEIKDRGKDWDNPKFRYGSIGRIA